MKRILSLALVAILPGFAATSQREPVSGLVAFDALPQASMPAHAVGLGWVSEGHAQGLVGSGPLYAAAVTAPNFKVSYAKGDLDLRDGQTDHSIAMLRRSQFTLGSGIALSQVGLGLGAFDWGIGADLVRTKVWDLDGASAESISSWMDVSSEWRWGVHRIDASVDQAAMLESEASVQRDPRLNLGYGQARSDGLQWGGVLTLPIKDDREFGFGLAIEKTFSQSLGFRVQGNTLYKKTVSTLPADDGARKWIRSGLGLAVGTSLRFRPWLSDRDPVWIRKLVDPMDGGGLARYLYDWELGTQIQIDAIGSRTAASATLGRWF